MGFFAMYMVYLKMNHKTTSAAFLQSKQYSRHIMIALNWLQMVSHLAMSMYFTMDINPGHYSTSQTWMYKVIIVTMPKMALFIALRWLLRNPATPA
jgi:hypothetical protein